MTVSAQTNPATVVFEDLGAVITVGAGCVSIDAHHARCTNEASALPIVNAGDLNDAVTSAPGAGVAANGGSGSDTLTGADKGDALDGGGGAGDVLAAAAAATICAMATPSAVPRQTPTSSMAAPATTRSATSSAAQRFP